jgi:hypothetical protein
MPRYYGYVSLPLGLLLPSYQNPPSEFSFNNARLGYHLKVACFAISIILLLKITMHFAGIR